MSVRILPSMASAIAHARHAAVAPLVWDPVEHLLSRFTFGPTATSRRRLAHSGPDSWFRSQLAAATKYRGYAGNTHVAAQGPLLKLSPSELRQWLKAHGNEYGWTGMDQLTRVTLGLQAWSGAQLYETLVDFFSNHLNVPNHNGDVWNTRHAYDRDVIRRHATGSFTDMLLASAKHPAMLAYLSLAQSTKSAVNENYGRELLELHTVGLYYKEDDVKNAARLLTGRTLDRNQNYVYRPAQHPTGPVTVLGFTAANATAEGGEAAGDALLRYLARHPDTAHNLARKLCIRYVSDAPSAALVAAVAKAYLASGTKIVPMISTILRSTEFWESRGKKVRRPTEHLLATIRVLGVGVSSYGKALQTLHWMSANVGHAPLDWPAPNGYPDVATAWRSSGTLLQSWERNLGFAGGWWEGFRKVNVPALYGGRHQHSGDAVARLAKRLTAVHWRHGHRAALQEFLGERPRTPVRHSTLRWLDVPLAALILDSPHHALR